jgi:biopolymer transport protein ExbD
MSNGRSATAPSKAERDLAFVLWKRGKKKIPEFEAHREIELVPYLDVMMNLVIFMLVTIASFMPLGILNIFPPTISRDAEASQPKPGESMNLTVAIDMAAGFRVVGSGAALPIVPKKATGDFDFDALTERLAEIKKNYPNERSVNLTADATVRYETVIKTMDAMRSKGKDILFDDVKIGVAE